jgi:hypothetical protein
MKIRILVPWHNPDVKEEFLTAWGGHDGRLHFQHDATGAGCAATKNAGIRTAIEDGIEVLVILDDDMRPHTSCQNIDQLLIQHLDALEPQEIDLFQQVTSPPNRGTPYFSRKATLPVACSLGWWDHIPDRDAAAQLVQGATAPMEFHHQAIFGRWFAGSGMNVAFRPREWWPWCQFVEGVGRFDDIWMFNLWAKEAYRRGHCFSLHGPTLTHARQSAVFRNLRDEAQRLEQNETLWQSILRSPFLRYADLRELIEQANYQSATNSSEIGSLPNAASEGRRSEA